MDNRLPGQAVEDYHVYDADGNVEAHDPHAPANSDSDDGEKKDSDKGLGENCESENTDSTKFAASNTEEPQRDDSEKLLDLHDDDDDQSGMTRSSGEELSMEELLEAFTEAFNEVDIENAGVISTDQLGVVMDGLAESECIGYCTQEELDMLANDMDVDGNGYIPLEEFKDVLLRRNEGYDFSDVEIKEAFSVLDLADKGTTSAKELRAVMLACCEMEVKFQDGKKMIQAASSVESKDKSVINFEEFKSILYWRPPEDFDFDPVGGHPVAQGSVGRNGLLIDGESESQSVSEVKEGIAPSLIPLL